MDAFEKRKNKEQNKKFNKQVSVLRKEEKQSAVKKDIQDVSKFRKHGAGDQDSEGKSKAIEDLVTGQRTGVKSFKRTAFVSLHILMHE